MMTDDIIILDGKYEVHPMSSYPYWSVVNSETGLVRNEGLGKGEAIELATELNEEVQNR